MKTIITIIFVILCIGCEGKRKSEKTIENSSMKIENSLPEINIIDLTKAKEIFQTPTIRYSVLEKGYPFNLPFNYRIHFVPAQNSENSYYKFQWKVTDDFTIDSNAEGFKRFSVVNFIPYLISAPQEGDFFIAKGANKTPLTIADFLKSVDEVLYKDENSAVFSDYGSLKAFYFEYLPKTKEYLIYLSDTPFQNKRPKAKSDEIINQFLHQIRMAKNIVKPIKNQEESWTSYENQLSILEKDFFKNINAETQKAFVSNPNLKSFSPADQGNNRYYNLFKINPETEAIWKKLRSVNNKEILTVTEEDKILKYLREENFRFFYHSYYQQIAKTEYSTVYQRKSEKSYCLAIKTKDNKLMIMKEFPALEQMSHEYYKNEIEFYTSLFENYK